LNWNDQRGEDVEGEQYRMDGAREEEGLTETSREPQIYQTHSDPRRINFKKN
jgi:hypothetical protein